MSAKIELGAMCDPLTKQLEGIADTQKLHLLDGHADAITRLHVHGLITCRECDAARKRLMKRIKAACTAKRGAK